MAYSCIILSVYTAATTVVGVCAILCLETTWWLL